MRPRELLRREFEVGGASGECLGWACPGAAVARVGAAHHGRDLDPAGPLTQASAGALRLRCGLRSTFRMSDLDLPRAWTWAGPVLGMDVHYHHRFEPCGADRTRITFVVEAEGWPGPLAGRLFTRIYCRNLDRAIPRQYER